MGLRLINDDATIFSKKYKYLECSGCKKPCCNWKYVHRVAFRIVDVIGRIGLLSFIWVAFDPIFLAVYVGGDLLLMFLITLRTYETYAFVLFNLSLSFDFFVAQNRN